MATLTLPTGKAPEMPTRTGWYLVWERYNDTPMVLAWGTQSRTWRNGASRVEAVRWAGPLPGRRDDVNL